MHRDCAQSMTSSMPDDQAMQPACCGVAVQVSYHLKGGLCQVASMDISTVKSSLSVSNIVGLIIRDLAENVIKR